jgi:C4-dicarboxylate-specific signal transduction histidine kinase
MIRAMSHDTERVSPVIAPRAGVSWWHAPREWSLTTRVLVSVTGYFLALLLVLLLTARQAEAQHRSVWLDQAGNSARAVGGTVAGFVSDLDSTTRAMSLAIARTPGAVTQQNTGPYLRTIAEEYGILRGLFVTDARGRVLATQSGEGIGLDLSGRPYMQSLLTGADTIWGSGVAGIETGDVTVTFGRTIRDEGGAVRGYLIAAFYPPKLAERLSAWVPSDADLTLIDRNGLVLHSTKHPVIPFKQRTVQINDLATAARESGRARLDGTPGVIDGLPTYGAAVPIPETGWTLIYARPLSAVEAAIQRQTWIQAAELTAAVAVVGVLLALSVTRITSPLRRLALAVQDVARGERPVIEVPEGQREPRGRAAARVTAPTCALGRFGGIRGGGPRPRRGVARGCRERMRRAA